MACKTKARCRIIGDQKIKTAEDFWTWAGECGDKRHQYLLEEFKPGIICHVDSLNYEDETLFTRCSQYLDAPFEVAHGGGIFQSKTMGTKDALAKKLVAVNKKYCQHLVCVMVLVTPNTSCVMVEKKYCFSRQQRDVVVRI